MERLHDRMPLILPKRLWSDWLTAAPDDAPHLLEAVQAVEVPRLVATPISDRVNSVANDGPELLEEDHLRQEPVAGGDHKPREHERQRAGADRAPLGGPCHRRR